MIALIILMIFLVITLAEALYLYFLRQRLEDAESLGDIASNVLGVNEQYKGLTAWVLNSIMKFRKILWVLVILIMFINFIVALILGLIIGIFI